MKREYIAPQSAVCALCSEDIMDKWPGSANVYDGKSGDKKEKIDVDNDSHVGDDWGTIEID